MGLFDFFKRKKSAPVAPLTALAAEVLVDRTDWKGKDFEFLLTGDIDIPNSEFDEIMTPGSFEWAKIERDNWIYYQVGNDEFSYSIEPPGIQMVFNRDISYVKAKKIVDEVIENIKMAGQDAELIVLDTRNIYKF